MTKTTQEIKSLLTNANAAYEEKNFNAAISFYLHAHKLDTHNAEILFNIGVCFDELKDYKNAIKNYEKAILLNANDAEIYNNLATSYKEIKEYEKSVYFYIKAIKLNSNFFDAYNNLGVVLEEQEKYDDAKYAYLSAIKINPEFAKAYSNLSGVFTKTKKYDDAINFAVKALQIDISLVGACINLGNAYKELGRYKDALIVYKRALEIDTDNIEAYNNMGAGLFANGEFEASFKAYQKALNIDSSNPDVEFNISFIHLLKNDYKTGFKLYEQRYNQKRKNKPMFYPDFKFPMWNGENLVNKTIVVLCEQGFGDDIMFIRYIPLLKTFGVKITLVCKIELLELFLQIKDIDEFKTIDELIGVYDYWVFLMSLPNFFESVPQQLPYLYANANLASNFLKILPNNKRLIGIVWRGSSLHSNDVNRSIYNINVLKPLLEVPNICFVSLQKGEDESVNNIDDISILSLGKYINNFADSAAIVSLLECVISVDTSIVHICGALNKKCFVMLNSVPEWRWSISGSETIWYSENIKLFRQKEKGNWGDVISEIANEIKLL